MWSPENHFCVHFYSVYWNMQSYWLNQFKGNCSLYMQNVGH